MFKNLLKFSVIFGVALPSLASAEGKPLAFTRDGIEYVATDSIVDGRRVLEGREVKSGRTFRLVVARGRVQGTYAGMPMSFIEPRKGVEQIASR